MTPDLDRLHELLDASPGLARRPAGGVAEPDLRRAEERVGPLPASYRWWLAEYGVGWIGGEQLATVAAPGFDDEHDAITAPWRHDGQRLCFFTDADGDAYSYALDRRCGDELPVVRRSALDGVEDDVADSFAGFLAVTDALARGLGDGPNPTVARLWRATPGLLRDDGMLIYGPHVIQERNETFEVADYAPEWVLVGDDSGGNGLLMRQHGRDRSSVWLLDLGAISENIEDDGELVTDDLIGWLEHRPS
ncbi:SMI1/KNR4 family protein [Micromonospora sp. CPCC 206060]|uniref:SMI1/KNR4 family protein n=1 Tax=Micromonospora sp. CPCC 206060 TaxID=3122406 RepID=UPI002FF293C2